MKRADKVTNRLSHEPRTLFFNYRRMQRVQSAANCPRIAPPLQHHITAVNENILPQHHANKPHSLTMKLIIVDLSLVHSHIAFVNSQINGVVGFWFSSYYSKVFCLIANVVASAVGWHCVKVQLLTLDPCLNKCNLGYFCCNFHYEK